MAQLGRALRSGRRGREFESRHPDHKKIHKIVDFYFEDNEYHQKHEYQSVFLRMLYNESKQLFISE